MRRNDGTILTLPVGEAYGDVRLLLEEIEATRHERLDCVRKSPVISYLIQSLAPCAGKRRPIQKRELPLTACILPKTISKIEREHLDVAILCRELLRMHAGRDGLVHETLDHHPHKPLYRFISQYAK